MIKLLAAKRGVKPAVIKSEDEIERRRKLKLENDNYVARQAEIKNIVDTAAARPAPLYDNQRVEPPKSVFKTNGFQPALIMPTEPPPVVTGSGSAGSIVKLANGKYKVVKAGDSNVQSDVPALGSDDIGVSAEEQASERLYNNLPKYKEPMSVKAAYALYGDEALEKLNAEYDEILSTLSNPLKFKLLPAERKKIEETENAILQQIKSRFPLEERENIDSIESYTLQSKANAKREFTAIKRAEHEQSQGFKDEARFFDGIYKSAGLSVKPVTLPGDDNPIAQGGASSADKIKALEERLNLVKWYGYAPVTTTANGYGEKGDAAVIEAELKRLKEENPDWNMNPDDYYDFSAAERAKKEQDAARENKTVNFAVGDSGFKDMVAYDAIIEKGTRDYTVRIEKGVKNGADVRIFNENTNEEERRNLAWIYGNAKNSKDIEVADRYREKLETLAKERQFNKEIDKIHESDPSGGWLTAPIVYTGRAAASMEAVPTYIAETALNLGKNMAEGTDYPVPTSSKGSSLIRRANHAEETIIENVPEELKPLARLGISAADSFIGAYISGPASPLILSMSAGAGAAYDAGERGGTGTQQLLTGIAQGGAEYFGEKLSFKGLEKWMNTSAGGAKEFALRALNQSIVEGNEEAATEIANVFSDLMIMGDKSNVQEYCANYMASHPGAKDAETILNAGLYIFGRTAEAWMGGAISGGVMGGAAQGVGAARTKRADSARTEAINTLAGAQIDKSYEVFKESGLFSDEAAEQLEKAGFAAAARKYDAARLATEDKVKEGSKFHELPIFGRDGSGKTVPIFHDDLQERRSRLAAGAENLEASTPAKIADTQTFTTTTEEGKTMVLPPVFRDGNPVSPVIETAPIEERNRKLEESRRAQSEADELLTEEEKSEIEKVNKLDDVELADFYRGEDERASNDEISTRVEAFRAFQALEEGVPVDKALPTKTLRFVQAAEKAFNVKIRFSNKLASGATLAGAAAYDGDTGEIVVDPKKAVRSDIANTIVMHEATHRLESMAEYPRLSSYAVKQRFGGENESFKKAVADKIAEYGRGGVTLTPESARREVVAEIISEQFSSEEDIKRLVTKQPKLAGRVLGAIRDACATIRTFVSSKGSRVSAVQELRRLQKLRGSLERAMREVKKSTAAKGDGDGVRYKIERGIDGNISAVDTPLEVDYTKEKGDESDVRPDKDNRGADSRFDRRGQERNQANEGQGLQRGGDIPRTLDDVSPNARRTLDEKRKPNIGLKSSQNNPAAFSNALEEAINSNKYGPYVIYHSAEELMADGAKLLLAENGMAGVAVFSDGNIGAVFNNDKSPVRGAADDLMLTALANGGNKLDNFDGHLSGLYARYGFEPVARVAFDPPRAPEGWRAEFGKPDVIFWKHNGDSVDTLAEKIGKYDLKDLSRLPLFAEYDEAYAYRDSLMLENAAITGKESSTDNGAALSSAQKGDVTDGGKVQNYLGEGDPNAFYEAEAARFNRWFKARKMSTINELIASSKEFASAKARGVSGKTKNAFLRSWADSFYLDAAGKRLFEEKMRVLENEIREDGKPQWRTKAALFDAAIENALESSPRMTEENEAVRATLRACRVNPSGIPAELIKKAQGKIRFSNSSSIGIDTFYGELSTEDPYRFPDSIWNIEDQAERIIEVYDSLAPNPAYLTDILAKEELEMVRDDFFRGLMAVENEFRNAIKYDSERTDAIATKAEAKEPFDFKAYAAKANEIEQKRRVYERILRDTTLPKGDMDDVASLRKGHKEESEIRESYNKDYIIELARAGAALDELTAPLDNYRRQHGEKMLNWARELTKDSDLWKNPKLVAGYRFSWETQERNIIDVAGETEGKKIIEEIFTPVHKNTAKANVFKNSYRDTVKALKLNSDESIYVQLLGEGIVTLDAVPTKGDDGKVINKAKVERAIDVFHKMYAEMLEKVNFALVENGYKPIAMRKNYFPHFNESNDALTVGLKKLGIEINRDELPADIAGLTQAFRPGKKYNPHFEHRKGNSTIYDAVRGFDSYVEGVADVIFHTEDIARLRAFETALREKNTDSTVQAKIDEVRADPSLDAAEKYDKITELLAVDNTQNSAYINNILIYTNLLAGKKHIGDRAMEADVGRACYSLITALENRVAANMVAINPGSWLTNFIPLTQAAAAVKTKNLYRGMYAQLVSNWKNDGFSDRSTFMINRKGSELLYKSKLQSITSVLAHPMTMIDEFTSGAVARAKYYEMLESGATEESAMSSADSFAAAVIADRSKGALPTCFEMRNPVRKLFTQFQLEVKNQFSFLFKDLPREKAREGIAAIAVALLKYFIGAYIFNDCYELVTGRRAAFDPISIANDLIGDITGYKLPNMVSTAWGAAANGKAPNFKTEKKNAVQTALHLGDNILQEVPFVGGLLTDGGRLPISSALPDLKILGPAVLELWDEDIAKSRTWAKIGKEFAKPVVYMGAPFGGGQAKKIAEGLATVAVGGSYTLDKNGNPQIQFPVAQTAGNAIKAAVFGKYSLPEAKNYVDNGFITMSVDKTECVTKLYKSGMSFDEFLLHDRKIKAIKGDVDAAGKTIDNTASLKKRKYIDALGLTSEQNYLMYDASNISKTVANAPDIAVALLSEGTQKKATEAHDKTGLSYEKFAAVYDEISRTNKRDDIGKKEKSEFIREMLFDDGSLSTPQKEILDSQFINDGTFMPVEKDVSYESEGQYRASKLSPEKYAAAKSTNAVTGIDYEIYVDFLEEYDQIRADKNSRGNSVAGSKKKKVKQLLATLPIEEWQRNWLYNTVYDKKNSEAYVRRMVDRAGLSKAEADELYNSYYSPE